MRLVLLILMNCCLNVVAQNWQQDLSFPGSPRDDGAAFTIGSIHYAGTGRSIDFSCTGDFFAFDSHLNYWAPIASLPIWQERQYASAFSYNEKGYVLRKLQRFLFQYLLEIRPEYQPMDSHARAAKCWAGGLPTFYHWI